MFKNYFKYAILTSAQDVIPKYFQITPKYNLTSTAMQSHLNLCWPCEETQDLPSIPEA